ncbi:MAG: hypothetical protein OEY28_06475, partial [Nitrospira sp.]|nr:hypothetical protein [Nitrospira sp.]
MLENNLSTWLDFALQQIAAESYLDDIDINDPIAVAAALVRGNNRQGFPEGGFTRFVDLNGVSNASQITGSAQAFVTRYQIVDHHANDATGFSATLMKDTQTGEYTLSFRSTEYREQVDGGDNERDSRRGADGEITLHGFAFGQLASMETYYQSLKTSGLLPAGAVLNVTGYSLGGHLATVAKTAKDGPTSGDCPPSPRPRVGAVPDSSAAMPGEGVRGVRVTERMAA